MTLTSGTNDAPTGIPYSWSPNDIVPDGTLIVHDEPTANNFTFGSKSKDFLAIR